MLNKIDGFERKIRNIVMHQSHLTCHAAQFAVQEYSIYAPAHLHRATILTIEFVVIKGTAE